MSHFSVLVVGPNAVKQLAPYQENNMGDCPKKYLVFESKDAELREQFKTGTTEMIRLASGELARKHDDRFKKKKVGTVRDVLLSPTEYVYPKGSKEVTVPFSEVYTLEQFAEDYHGYKIDAERGEYGYWTNPNTKWDWHELGGRWTGFFKLKKGVAGRLGRPGVMTEPAEEGYADCALKKDIDFDGMRAEARAKADKNWVAVNEAAAQLWRSWDELTADPAFKDVDKRREFYNNQPAIRRIRQKLSFWELDDFLQERKAYVEAAGRRAISTFAVLMNGEWFEKGSMGWFGCVADEKEPKEWEDQFQALFDKVSDDTLLSVYDCHI